MHDNQLHTRIQNKTHIFFFYWLPIILYCLLIYLQSSHPAPENLPGLPHLDKFLHLAAYAVLSAMFLRALRTLSIGDNVKWAMMLSIFLSTVYGITDELHQHFVPARSAELADVFADMIGSILGAFIYLKLTERSWPVWIKSWIDKKGNIL